MSDFPPVAQLMPHSDPMVLLDRLASWSPGEAVCALRVRADAPFVEDGRLAAPWMLEHMAQSVAVCLGYEAYLGGQGARIGMVVGCRSFDVQRQACPVGAELEIFVRQERGNESSSQFACRVSESNETVAEAVLTLFYGELPGA